jgi:hypothetical protein
MSYLIKLGTSFYIRTTITYSLTTFKLIFSLGINLRSLFIKNKTQILNFWLGKDGSTESKSVFYIYRKN